ELIRVDLREANLNGLILDDADLGSSDLRQANLSNTKLIHADLRSANLADAKLKGATLSAADLRGADLSYADLSEANLYGARIDGVNFIGTNLSNANLKSAELDGANFINANLSKADLSKTTVINTIFNLCVFKETNFNSATLGNTAFSNVDLSELQGLDSCAHYIPSSVDVTSLLKSLKKIPQVFLRGIGLPEIFIDYLPSLAEIPIQYYSCFISYSNKDVLFAQRLHNDLQNNGVRCWFAPEDMKIGDKIRDTIYEAIKIRDKLLVILSKDSINSDWLEEEVEKALAEEQETGRKILFPIRIDDYVMETGKAFVQKIKNNRHIGDFTKWKEPEEYKKVFDRLLRDLKVD
ncbi:MAG: toll/interleukin-1 receptor domain-containing protein, partial [Bacteroidetes bacterium]|nr:toll/interleukin-1 receptor domain-containing protein [Bacteroidota bacterium]